MDCDAAIFGGGAAGLWLLDLLTRRGAKAVLLEAGELGAGQTIASQGIIHGGLKYTLQGLLTASASNIAEMPGLWRSCLAGRQAPDLTRTRLRSEYCHLWRTDSFASRMGMFGAKFGLRVAPQSLRSDDRPDVLRQCPGDVARLDEQVIAPFSFLNSLASQHREQLLQIDFQRGLEFGPAGTPRSIFLTTPGVERTQRNSLTIRPRWIVLTAGAGNAALRQRLGLSTPVMQRRPLHMVMARGELPALNGHCVDGARTRVTVTTDVDRQGLTVWQVGGQIAEAGVASEPQELILQARKELTQAIPGLDLSRVEFSTYRVDRAEGLVAGGKRPDSYQIIRDGNVLTAWPTKLVLAPVLAESIAATILAAPFRTVEPLVDAIEWPRPRVALPPWETAAEWHGQRATPRRAA